MIKAKPPANRIIIEAESIPIKAPRPFQKKGVTNWLNVIETEIKAVDSVSNERGEIWFTFKIIYGPVNE